MRIDGHEGFQIELEMTAFGRDSTTLSRFAVIGGDAWTLSCAIRPLTHPGDVASSRVRERETCNAIFDSFRVDR